MEFALVMPLLLMLLFGIISTGLAFADHLSATNAAREAARYGAATNITDPGAWAISVRTRAQDVYFSAEGNDLADSQICVKLVDSSGATVSGTSLSSSPSTCGTAPLPPAGMAAGSCAVMVWMTRPQTIQLLAFPDLDFDVKAQSVAYYSRVVSPCTAA